MSGFLIAIYWSSYSSKRSKCCMFWMRARLSPNLLRLFNIIDMLRALKMLVAPLPLNVRFAVRTSDIMQCLSITGFAEVHALSAHRPGLITVQMLAFAVVATYKSVLNLFAGVLKNGIGRPFEKSLSDTSPFAVPNTIVGPAPGGLVSLSWLSADSFALLFMNCHKSAFRISLVGLLKLTS